MRVLELSVEEQHRLAQQWKAQGRKACSICGAKHPPPCDPGIVKKKKTSKLKLSWCRSCQDSHLFGKHTRTRQEAAELRTQQAYGMAPIPWPMVEEPNAMFMAPVLTVSESRERRMMFIHQAPRILGGISYQGKLNLRTRLYPDDLPTALTWEEHVFWQYLQESIESHRDEEDGQSGQTGSNGKGEIPTQS